MPKAVVERAWDLSEYLAITARETERLAEAAARAGLDAAVPACPGWRIRDLIRHIGGLTQGLISLLETPRPRPPSEDDHRSWFAGSPQDRHLLGWYLDVRSALRTAFMSADPAAEYFTFMPAITSPLLFWARRDAHETAIHRADAEQAAHTPVTPFAPDFAADGIGELLTYLSRPGGSLTHTSPVTVVFAAGDTDDRWTVRLDPDGCYLRPDRPTADATMTGTANDLYLALWNRAEFTGLNVTGDPAILTTWRARARWGFTEPEEQTDVR